MRLIRCIPSAPTAPRRPSSTAKRSRRNCRQEPIPKPPCTATSSAACHRPHASSRAIGARASMSCSTSSNSARRRASRPGRACCRPTSSTASSPTTRSLRHRTAKPCCSWRGGNEGRGTFLPTLTRGEVARRAGGVMPNSSATHDPSVRFADTSPTAFGREARRMSLGRAVATVGSFTLLSRISGFIRDIVLTALLGSGAIADAFIVAFKLPNFFRRLFAEGAFSAAFVPLFSGELQAHGRQEAVAFARQAHAALLLVLVLFSALLIVAMPAVVALLAPGMRDDAPTFAMAVEFGRIGFPYLLFISLATLYGGVLNSIDRFAHVAATPILLNLALVGAVLGLTPLLPNSGYAASIGLAFAGLLQWVWLLVTCARDGIAMKLVWPRWNERLARLVKLATPVAIGSGVQQISVRLDVVWASLMPVGTISALYYADRIAQLPLGIVGIAIGTALLPLLARQLRAGQDESAMANLNRAVEFGLLFSLPAALAMWLMAEPIIRMLFQRGQFGPDDTWRTAGAL